MSIADLYREMRQELLDYIHSAWRLDDDAEDILHDVFTHLLLLDRAEPVQDYIAYLYRSVRNNITDRNRKHTEERMPQMTYTEGEEIFMQDMALLLQDREPQPDEQLERKQLRERLQRAIDSLPTEQRDVFVKTEIEGVSFHDLAEATGVPLNTLLSRKHYAVKTLRKKLSQS